MKIVLRLTVLLDLALGYKILVCSPQIGHSHVTFLGHIADTLVEAGHDVLVYLPAINRDVTASGVKLARTLNRSADFETRVHAARLDFWQKRQSSLLEIHAIMEHFAKPLMDMCKNQLTDSKIIHRLKAEKFDLAISEAYNQCAFVLFEMVGVRTYITASATVMMPRYLKAFGIPTPPSHVPEVLSEFGDEMTYTERVVNLLLHVFTSRIESQGIGELGSMLRSSFGKDFNVFELMARSAFIFVNAEEYTEFPQPISHKVIYVGGIGVQKPRPLPQEYREMLESARGGAVLVSFGSFAQSFEMPPKIKAAFLQLFRAFPNVTFLWKYEAEDHLTAGFDNVVRRKWFPQNDLLGHPNLKAFISHGGQNSILESTHRGVPMVCIPLYADQLRNAKVVEKRRTAVIVNKAEISAEKLSAALRKVLYGTEVRASAKRLAKMIQRKPMSAKDRVVEYVEFAAEFGNFDNLDMASKKLSFLQLYSLDIIVPVAGILTLTSCLVSKLLWLLLRSFVAVRKVKQE